MTRVMMAVALWLGLVVAAPAQNREIEAVIGNQIEAFKADDFVTAFTFASPTIRQVFRTPETFGQMVRQGYPMVWRPSELRFLDLREVAGTLWQRVQITDAEGRVHLLDYQMVETEIGWKINAVQILQAPGVAA